MKGISYDEVSPCFGEGSGLKHAGGRVQRTQGEGVSPCFGEGSGLKLVPASLTLAVAQVSPCFGEGSGLKQGGAFCAG